MANKQLPTFPQAVKQCIDKVCYLKSRATPIVQRIKDNNLGEDYVNEIRAILIEFDEIKEVFGALPLDDGVVTRAMSEKEKKEAIDMIPKLVEGLEELAAAHALMIESLKKGLEANTERMELMRKAKNIFDKFIKAPKQEPRFFDKIG